MSILGRILDSQYLGAAVRGTGVAMAATREGRAAKRASEREAKLDQMRENEHTLAQKIGGLNLKRGEWSFAEEQKGPQFGTGTRDFNEHVNRTGQIEKATGEVRDVFDARQSSRRETAAEAASRRAYARQERSADRADARAARRQRAQDTEGGPASTSAARSRNYWQDVAATLVAAHGGDAVTALNEAANGNKNPEYRRARQTGQLRPEFFHAAANQMKGKGSRSGGTMSTRDREQERWDQLAAEARRAGLDPVEAIGYDRP